MKKKVLIIIVAIVLVILFLVICCQNIFLSLLVQLQESPTKPQIKYCEFDYSLVYSISRDEIRADGTLVFEYDGVSN